MGSWVWQYRDSCDYCNTKIMVIWLINIFTDLGSVESDFGEISIRVERRLVIDGVMEGSAFL